MDTVTLTDGKMTVGGSLLEETYFACQSVFCLGITFGNPSNFDESISICEECINRGKNMIAFERRVRGT